MLKRNYPAVAFLENFLYNIYGKGELIFFASAIKSYQRKEFNKKVDNYVIQQNILKIYIVFQENKIPLNL